MTRTRREPQAPQVRNIFPGVARRVSDGAEVELDAGGRVLSAELGQGRVGVVVAPWHVSLGPDVLSSGANILTGPVTSVAPRGASVRVTVGSVPPVMADVPATAALAAVRPGTVVAASWPPGKSRLTPEAPPSR